MTLPTGTVCETKVEDRLRSMVAACATYDDFIDKAGEPAATILATVHVDSFPLPADGEEYTAAEFETLFDGAMLWLDEEDGVEWDRASESQFVPSGVAHLRLRRIVPTADRSDPEKAHRDFKNQTGAIVDELTQQIGEDDTTTIRILNIKRSGPWESERDELVPWLAVEYAIRWG